MEAHYASWLETMCSQFGHQWLCFQMGPVWQYKVEPQVALQVYTYGMTSWAWTLFKMLHSNLSSVLKKAVVNVGDTQNLQLAVCKQEMHM